jgi:hypothetical protein
MPTRIAKLGRERTVATLARRVYQIEGRGDPEVMRRAEAKLLAANPRLATAEGFSSGASIVVPFVRGLRRAESVTDAEVSGSGLSAEIGARLEAMRSRIDDAFRKSADNRKETLDRLSNRQFVAEARRALPQSAEFIAAATRRLNLEEQDEAERAKRLQEGVAGAIEALKALETIVRRHTER